MVPTVFKCEVLANTPFEAWKEPQNREQKHNLSQETPGNCRKSLPW